MRVRWRANLCGTHEEVARMGADTSAGRRLLIENVRIFDGVSEHLSDGHVLIEGVPGLGKTLLQEEEEEGDEEEDSVKKDFVHL